MKRQIKQQRGFTLIELLVSMMVIVIVGSVILSIFFSVLRGSNKTDKIIQVRQNGNYAISQVTKMIRGARSIDCVPPEPSVGHVTVTDEKGSLTTISCSEGKITAVGASSTTELSDDSKVNVECSFSCSQQYGSLMKLVGITLEVSATQGEEETAPEDQATQEFKTSVVIRSTE